MKTPDYNLLPANYKPILKGTFKPTADKIRGCYRYEPPLFWFKLATGTIGLAPIAMIIYSIVRRYLLEKSGFLESTMNTALWQRQSGSWTTEIDCNIANRFDNKNEGVDDSWVQTYFSWLDLNQTKGRAVNPTDLCSAQAFQAIGPDHVWSTRAYLLDSRGTTCMEFCNNHNYSIAGKFTKQQYVDFFENMQKNTNNNNNFGMIRYNISSLLSVDFLNSECARELNNAGCDFSLLETHAMMSTLIIMAYSMAAIAIMSLLYVLYTAITNQLSNNAAIKNQFRVLNQEHNISIKLRNLSGDISSEIEIPRMIFKNDLINMINSSNALKEYLSGGQVEQIVFSQIDGAELEEGWITFPPPAQDQTTVCYDLNIIYDPPNKLKAPPNKLKAAANNLLRLFNVGTKHAEPAEEPLHPANTSRNYGSINNTEV
jgi:hypothetical protein